MSFGDEVLEAIALDVLAVELFGTYNEAGPNPWKTWDGKDVPQWDHLTDQVRDKWRAVAAKALSIAEDE